MLERLPGQFQDHPLLRVQGLRLAGGNTEESRIEMIDPLHEASTARGLLQRRRHFGAAVLIIGPAVAGQVADRTAALNQKVPITL